jgi:hypothetical protein
MMPPPHTGGARPPPPGERVRLTGQRSASSGARACVIDYHPPPSPGTIRVRVEIMGPGRYENVGKSQSVISRDQLSSGVPSDPPLPHLYYAVRDWC